VNKNLSNGGNSMTYYNFGPRVEDDDDDWGGDDVDTDEE